MKLAGLELSDTGIRFLREHGINLETLNPSQVLGLLKKIEVPADNHVVIADLVLLREYCRAQAAGLARITKGRGQTTPRAPTPPERGLQPPPLRRRAPKRPPSTADQWPPLTLSLEPRSGPPTSSDLPDAEAVQANFPSLGHGAHFKVETTREGRCRLVVSQFPPSFQEEGVLTEERTVPFLIDIGRDFPEIVEVQVTVQPVGNTFPNDTTWRLNEHGTWQVVERSLRGLEIEAQWILLRMVLTAMGFLEIAPGYTGRGLSDVERGLRLVSFNVPPHNGLYRDGYLNFVAYIDGEGLPPFSQDRLLANALIERYNDPRRFFERRILLLLFKTFPAVRFWGEKGDLILELRVDDVGLIYRADSPKGDLQPIDIANVLGLRGINPRSLTDSYGQHWSLLRREGTPNLNQVFKTPEDFLDESRRPDIARVLELLRNDTSVERVIVTRGLRWKSHGFMDQEQWAANQEREWVRTEITTGSQAVKKVLRLVRIGDYFGLAFVRLAEDSHGYQAIFSDVQGREYAFSIAERTHDLAIEARGESLSAQVMAHQLTEAYQSIWHREPSGNRDAMKGLNKVWFFGTGSGQRVVRQEASLFRERPSRETTPRPRRGGGGSPRGDMMTFLLSSALWAHSLRSETDPPTEIDKVVEQVADEGTDLEEAGSFDFSGLMRSDANEANEVSTEEEGEVVGEGSLTEDFSLPTMAGWTATPALSLARGAYLTLGHL